MRVLKFELYRAFHSRTFLISILIGIVICALELCSFYAEFGAYHNKYLVQAWIGTEYVFAYNQMFYILLPVIACLPYGGSYFTDIKTGYEKNICVKSSRLMYVFSKSIATFLSAFVAVLIPLGLDLFVVAGIFPNYSPERLQFMCISLTDVHLFTEILFYHPVIYCVIFTLIDCMFAGIIALISISVTKIVKSHFSAVVLPMVMLIISSVLLTGDGYGNWCVLEMLNPNQYVVTFWYQMLIVFCLITAVNIFSIWLVNRKRDVL